MVLPIGLGDKIKLKIVNRGSQGDPMGFYKNLAVILKDEQANIGDKVQVEVIELRERCVIARLVARS